MASTHNISKIVNVKSKNVMFMFSNVFFNLLSLWLNPMVWRAYTQTLIIINIIDSMYSFKSNNKSDVTSDNVAIS